MHEPDITILREAGCSEDVVAHCTAVSALASSLAKRVRIAIDLELVRRGGLLHDLGRARTNGIDHALVGAELGRSLGLPEALVSIIERHIGAGISTKEAVRLGLPEKEYFPLTPEEKLVSYADNLMSGVREQTFSEALARFQRILGPNHESVELFRCQDREIRGWSF